MKPLLRAVLVRKGNIDEVLRLSPVNGKHTLEPFASFAKESGLPFKVLEDTNVRSEAEVHRNAGDLWYCLEGEVTFRSGGELVDPRPRTRPDGTADERELRAKEIRDGVETVLAPGDWLWIPAGAPHQHSATGTARLVIVKIPKGA